MKRVKKIALKILSYPNNYIKEYYKLYRKIQNALHLYFKPKYKLMDHKVLAGEREIPVRIFLPKKDNAKRIMVFFHGGGWVTGNIDSYTKTCANLANQTRSLVVSIDYRLAPEHPFPEGIEDCYLVTRELFLNRELLSFKSEEIILIGDSAGGNLAAAISLMARDRGEFLPHRQILIYPLTYYDHSDSCPFPSVKENGTDYILTAKGIQDYMDLYVPNPIDRCSPYVAPLLSEDLSHQPDTLVITAQFDPLRDEGEAYGKKLGNSGSYVEIHRISEALHGFFSLPWRSEKVIKCYTIINSFLNRYDEPNGGNK